MGTNLEKKFGIDKMSALEVEAFLDKEYRAPGGVEKFCQILAGVIFEDILYEGRIRQCLDLYMAKPGEDISFDGDPVINGARLSIEGLPEIVEAKTTRWRVDTSPSAVEILVRWNEKNYRKFDITKRAYDRAKAKIQELEDTRGISVINTASTLFHSAISATTSNLISKIAQGKATMWSRGRVTPVKMLMNPILEQYLLVPVTSAGYPIYMPSVQESQWTKGILGKIFGLEIVGSDRVAENTIYILGPKEYVGKLCVRSEIDTKVQPSVPHFGDLSLFWVDEGFIVRYSRGIQKITVA